MNNKGKEKIDVKGVDHNICSDCSMKMILNLHCELEDTKCGKRIIHGIQEEEAQDEITFNT